MMGRKIGAVRFALNWNLEKKWGGWANFQGSAPDGFYRNNRRGPPPARTVGRGSSALSAPTKRRKKTFLPVCQGGKSGFPIFSVPALAGGELGPFLCR